MGIYLNPNNGRFLQAVNSKIYVDKSQLIAFTNERIGTEQKKYLCKPSKTLWKVDQSCHACGLFMI